MDISLGSGWQPVPSGGASAEFYDNLLIGPSALLWEDHVTARTKAARAGKENLTRSYQVIHQALCAPRVTVWTRGHWSDQLAFGLLCANRATDTPIEVIEANAAVSAPRLLSDLETRAAAELWRTFTGSHAATFLHAASAVAYGGRSLRSVYGDVFPRIIDGARLLSRLDEALLRAGETAATPGQFLASGSIDDAARFWAQQAGDGFISDRLDAWTHFPRGAPALQSERGIPRLRRRYRITERGRTLLTALPRLGDAPPLQIGGLVAYDPANPIELDPTTMSY